MSEPTHTSTERADRTDDPLNGSPEREPSRFTSTARRVSDTARRRLPATRDVVLSVVVAFNFAVAYPVLDVLGRHPEFFTARGSPWSDLVGLAVVVTVVAPTLLAVAVRLCVAAHHLVGFVVHALLVTTLLALLLLRLLPSMQAASPPYQAWLVPAGTVLAAAAAVGIFYASTRLRAFVRAGVVAPVGFAALFLLAMPARSLVLPADDGVAAEAAVADPAPVVMLVTDELPLVTLLDAQADGVDEQRFPNFARLAEDATWFTNTTTNHAFTSRSLPAVLTGRRVTRDVEPTLAHHPVNLFSLLDGDYRVRASEHLTQLCPDQACPRSAAATPTRRWRLLASDTGVVGLHTLLPDFLGGDELPPIDHAWAGFAGGGPRGEQARDYEEFLAGIGRTRQPALHYFHLPKPHFPWRMLPSGQHYTRGNVTPGLVPTERGLRWAREPWPAAHGWQRHLLQAGAVDAKLGRLLDRLEATGTYEDALVVVLSDHGVAFQPGVRMRHVTDANVADVAFVPLFVKPPGQTDGRRVARPAQLVDVLPTVLRLLDTETPHAFDGRALRVSESTSSDADGKSAPGRGGTGADGQRLRLIESYGRTRAVDAGLDDVAERVAARIDRFGMNGWESVWRAGPRPQLLGRSLSRLGGRVDESVDVTLDDPGTFDDVDLRADDVPALLVTGTVAAQRPLGGPVDVAVVVNGRVAATGQTYDHEGRRGKVSVLVPPEAYRQGPNDVQVVALRADG